MLMTLQRLDKNPASGIERYFQSHPDPAKRVKDVRAKVAELSGTGMLSASSAQPDRNAYVHLLDGMITANSTEHLVIRDGMIYDRDHGLAIRAPQGWIPTTAPGVVFAMTPRGNSSNSQFVAQEVPARELQGRDAQNAVRIRLEQMGLQYAGSRQARFGTGESVPIDVWQGQTQAGVVGVETTQFVHGDHVMVFMFISPSVNERNSPLAQVLSNVERNPARVNSVQAPRIHIATVRNGDTWADLARRATGNSRDAEALANMNGYDAGTRPEPGILVKMPEEVIPEE
jgi:predicted Zn-dependent protease